MNKFLRVLFVLVIIAMSGAIVFQLFFPTYMGSHSGCLSICVQVFGDTLREVDGSPLLFLYNAFVGCERLKRAI